MIVGITGGSGCGKTTLLDVLRAHGAQIFDCDAVYHTLLQTDAAMLAAIGARFPGTVEDGALNRKKLGAVVFSDKQALRDLNAITHAAVRQEILRCLEAKPALAAIDAISLFEGGLAELCDVTVAVTAPDEARIARLQQRDGITGEYARLRIRAQHDNAWFRQHCGYILENDSTYEQFRIKCLAFLREIGIIN